MDCASVYFLVRNEYFRHKVRAPFPKGFFMKRNLTVVDPERLTPIRIPWSRRLYRFRTTWLPMIVFISTVVYCLRVLSVHLR